MLISVYVEIFLKIYPSGGLGNDFLFPAGRLRLAVMPAAIVRHGTHGQEPSKAELPVDPGYLDRPGDTVTVPER
jgi:hypothetical protein